MKKLLFVLALNFTFISIQAQNLRYDTIRYARDYYQERVALFQREKMQKDGIIFLGNSIIQFGDWKKLAGDSSIVNRGIAGDNTFGVLDRLEDVLVREPRKVFIEIGINDLSQNIPIPIIVKNILTIVNRIRSSSPQARIYILSILPTNDNVKNEYPDAFNKNSQANEANKQIMREAREHKFMFIDANKKLRDTTGKLSEKYAEPDGLHLNDQGYQVLIGLLKSMKCL